MKNPVPYSDWCLSQVMYHQGEAATMPDFIHCLTTFDFLGVVYKCIKIFNARYTRRLPFRTQLIPLLNSRLATHRPNMKPKHLVEVREFIINFQAVDILDFEAYLNDYPDYAPQPFFTRQTVQQLLDVLR